MSIAPSPEPPPASPQATADSGLTRALETPPAMPPRPGGFEVGPESAPTVAPGPNRFDTLGVPDGGPPARRRGTLGGLILIALGLVALGGIWFPASGAWLFLGLGGAFLMARVLTGRCGYAVPAGLLLAFGSFVWLTETGAVKEPGAGGTFFVLLGLGFLAAYAIAARPEAVWPILPGTVLIAFGGFLQGALFGVPVDRVWWLAPYWPVSLLVLGAWLLIRDQLPVAMRAPVAVIGASVLILIGLLVVAAGLSTLGGPYARTGLPMPWAPMFQGMPAFGNPPLVDTVTVSAPAGVADSIRVVNTSGSTVVRSISGSDVRVLATRHYWAADQAPDVRLTTRNTGLQVEAPTPAGAGNTYVDYVIETPARLGADVSSTSGLIEVSGLVGTVRAEAASGQVNLRDLQGPVIAATTSGAVRLANIGGDLRIATVSGGIQGSGLDRVADAHSTSGGIDLQGEFASDALVASTSGGVTLRFAPDASVRIDASSLSGDIDVSGLPGIGAQATAHRLTGNVGGGAHAVSIHTTSGGIRLAASG